MMFMTLLRHGRSVADDENRYEGRYDSDLTDKGTEQVRNLLDRWEMQGRRNYDVIVTSPLKRAKATAAILSTLYRVEVVESDLLAELDAGALSGMEKEEGMRKYSHPGFRC